MGLIDSPWHLLIILVVFVMLFGARKLPDSARSLGEAMRIFKHEAQKLHDDGKPAQTPVQGMTQPELAPSAQAMTAQGTMPQAATMPAPVVPQTSAGQQAPLVAPPLTAPQTPGAGASTAPSDQRS